MRSEEARVGTRLRVCEHHRISERRGVVGRIVGRYGGEDYVAVDVRFPDRQYRLFWPEDLEEISPQGLRGSVNRRVANVTTVGQEALQSFGEL